MMDSVEDCWVCWETFFWNKATAKLFGLKDEISGEVNSFDFSVLDFEVKENNKCKNWNVSQQKFLLLVEKFFS